MEPCNPLLLQLELLPAQLGNLLANPALIVHEVLGWTPPGITAALCGLHGYHVVGLNQKVGEAHQLQ